MQSQRIQNLSGKLPSKPFILRGFFALVVAYQLFTLTQNFIIPRLERVWDLRQMPYLQRSALQQGGDIGLYIRFLRDNIPEDALVMLPPRIPQRPVAHIGFMQYFLYPREIHNCGPNEVEACLQRSSHESIYVLGVEGFPPDGMDVPNKQFIRFDETKGLYIPVDSAP